MIREKVEVVFKLEQCEIDEAKEMRPDVDRLIGENESTEQNYQK